ncbi:U3 small nucleolar ribonucleoprotein protein MPP10 [Eumeta japonica]|uniref:U3 small nucleolar ribonucleoprotein protein MPP10 n=1 Tax=Eumeta variegata TaxID=151549 RepID=A0A4C1W4B6_EUMVA|nr:U3 small nucleolar ribonucleoprotein protein MPP10 [Eumeta japonica]
MLFIFGFIDFSVQSHIKDKIKDLIKDIYDHTKAEEDDKSKKKSKALPELIVDDFDEEQIWQEIELQNSAKWDQFLSDVSKCITVKKELSFPITYSKKETSTMDLQMEEIVPVEYTLESQNKINENKSKKGKIHTKPSSVVDDNFFKLDEMEKFLIKEDKRASETQNKLDSDEESLNMFEDIEESDKDGNDKDCMYSDFFNNEEQDENNDSGNKNKEVINSDEDSIRESDGMEESDVESDVENMPISNKDASGVIQLSEFQLRQKRLKEKISKLEKKTLEDKPWQLKGEVNASNRPQNSLLQEVVEFDLTSRPPPVITKESTVKLEDIIKRRIIDKAWDDVEKKAKPVTDVHVFKKTEVLDQAKSKLSLAQVYEAEYIKQKQNLTADQDNTQEEPQEHIEIRNKLKSLFSKLDSLSHCHYTPKPAQPEIKIISNIPAIMMEEIVPVAVNDATLLAPEEIKGKHCGQLMSKNERTTTDKKRERRKKKKLQKQKAQQNTKHHVTNDIKKKKFGK